MTTLGPDGRAVPFYCAYCGEEDIEPIGERGAWWCRTCNRRWALRLEGNGPGEIIEHLPGGALPG